MMKWFSLSTVASICLLIPWSKKKSSMYRTASDTLIVNDYAKISMVFVIVCSEHNYTGVQSASLLKSVVTTIVKILLGWLFCMSVSDTSKSTRV